MCIFVLNVYWKNTFEKYYVFDLNPKKAVGGVV